MSRQILLALVGLLVVTAACSRGGSAPPTAAELQADLASHNIDFAQTGEALLAESRPDLVDRAALGFGSGEAEWIYPGLLTSDAVSPPGTTQHLVWAVFFSDAERIASHSPGGTAIADFLVFVDSTTLAVLLIVGYTLPV